MKLRPESRSSWHSSAHRSLCTRFPTDRHASSCSLVSQRTAAPREGDVLQVSDFTIGGVSAMKLDDRLELPASGIDLEELERSLVVQALERSAWNQTRAATLLGLNRDQIRYRIEKFKLEKPAAT